MDMTMRAMNSAERNYCYAQSQQISMQTGLIGHLRADMDSSGTGFFSSFFNFRAALKTEDFKTEFDAVINALRFDESYGGILKDRSALSSYCHGIPESSFGGDGREFGFRVDTKQYSYMLRLNPNRGEYNMYCYCYQKKWLDRHLQQAERGIRFINPHYKELFRVPDGDKIRIIHSDGEKTDYTCRYIDDYHVEIGSGWNSLLHICQFAEIMERNGSNPLIIEKCNLDMEVGKLNMLKASYLSQKYALEDMVLKKYPEAITRLTERIAGYEQDAQLSAAHPKPQEGFAGITILEQSYTEKEAAGKAILDVCTKMTGSDAVFLGQYRGFSLTLSYDGASNEYRMTMKGTLSHTAVLGADVFGNLTRMDNVIDGLPGKLEAVRAELADTRVQLENARTELAAPFAREAELAEKTARLKELNILLNMDQKDNALIDDAPDEDVPERPRLKGMER